MKDARPITATKARSESGTMKSGVYAIAAIACIVLGSMVVYAAFASAATNAPAETSAGVAPVKAQMPACPMCPMMTGKEKGMGEKMDMSPAMQQRCEMMMKAELSKDEASCLLAAREGLKLTPEQIQKLEQLVKENREKAAAILTPEQQKTLAEVPAQPTSMAAMHAEMHEKMMQKHEKMMQKPEGTATKTTEEKTKKEVEKQAESAGTHNK